MASEKHLDYLQGSLELSETIFRDDNYKAVPPPKFYTRCYCDNRGTRYSFGNPKSKKANIIMGGRALQETRNEGYSDEQILSSLLEKGAKFTRVDMAITQDTNDVYCSLDHIQACFFAKKITSPLVARGAKKISSLELDGNEYPETFYIGDLKKRGEKGLFRAYDKGLELIGQRDLLIRLELESRKDIAHRNAVLIAKGQSIASVFRARFDIEDEKFQAVLDAPKTEIMRGLAKEKDKELDEMARRKKWLLEQVAPVMSKVIREEKDVEALRTFLEHFIISSGLREEMQHGANWLYGQKNLEYYGHIDRTQDKKDK
jgi:hypothetical protein